jgi:mono/diheme cytochrome c family protein
MWMQNLKIFLVVIGTLGLYTWAANAIPQVESEVPTELAFGADVTAGELVRAGEALYAGAGQCTTCHGSGERAPNLLTDHAGAGPIGQRCAQRVAGEDCKAYLFRSLVEPGAYVVDGFAPIMPDPRANLSDNQIWAVVAYLQDQGGEVTVTGTDLASAPAAAAPAGAAAEPAQPATAPAPAPGGPTSAALDPVQILRDNACLGCHLLAGEGAPIGPPFDGMGGRLGADAIRRSILDPRAEAATGFEAFQALMPAIYGQNLTAAQLEAIVQFLAARK